MLLFNAHHEPVTFTLPESKWGETWSVVVDTREWAIEADNDPVKAGDSIEAEARSVVVLCRGS